jgi:hypothetical protein
MTPRRWAGVLAVPLLFLAACSGGGNRPSPTPSPTPASTTTPTSGPQVFIADISAAGFGDKDTSDPAFLAVGNTACQGLAAGVSYGQQVQAFVESDAKPTQAQAETLVRSAVANLCPENAGMLPR